MAAEVVTSVPFLAKSELYGTEKPYGADFPVSHIPEAKLSNHIFDTREITIHDIRHAQQPLDLETNGACFIKAKTSLLPEDASNSLTGPMVKYTEEIKAALLKAFPQYEEIRAMDFGVRKRDPEFPNGVGKTVKFAQPAAMPHSDFSVEGAWRRMGEVFEDPKIYQGRQFDLLNIWRVLKGPNDDWPLAVCDATTVDLTTDISTNDALHHERVGENWLLHHSENQRWYYLSRMEDDDLIVFRNIDSEGTRSRCFHAAFNNPKSNGGLRESVEVRVAAFRRGNA